MDGSVVDEKNLRWQGGYPQDSRERRCVELYKGRYYNWGCHNKAQFICQINTKKSCAAPSKTLLILPSSTYSTQGSYTWLRLSP